MFRSVTDIIDSLPFMFINAIVPQTRSDRRTESSPSSITVTNSSSPASVNPKRPPLFRSLSTHTKFSPTRKSMHGMILIVLKSCSPVQILIIHPAIVPDLFGFFSSSVFSGFSDRENKYDEGVASDKDEFVSADEVHEEVDNLKNLFV